MSLQYLSFAVHQMVEEQVKKTPNKIAIKFLGRQLTYRELNAQANQLAHHLRTLGIQSASVIGICTERSIEQIVAILAILKAGGAYLPLDLAYPVERLSYMLRDSKASMLITQKHLKQKLAHADLPTICLDSVKTATNQLSPENLACSSGIDDAAYTIYTSGSTGQPKGVLMPHQTLANLLCWQHSALRPEPANTLQFTPISFDVSFQEIFSTLSSGGTLVLIEDDTRRNPEALLDYMGEYRIERLFLPFVALQHIAEIAANQPERPIFLKEVITAGEQLKITRSIASWFEHMDQCTLYNHYGPSESHVVTAYALTGPPRDWPHLPPIGRPITNSQLYVLRPDSQRKGDALELVEPGEPGELVIGGITLAKGYINKPELTNKKFLKDPFSQNPDARIYRTGDLVRLGSEGDYEYLDRLDNQVKIRGFRIELGEVEATLSQATFVKDIAVIARENDNGGKHLVAYIVANAQNSESKQSLVKNCKLYLKERLPEYMVPSIYMIMDALPLTPSGKVNRRELPELEHSRPDLEQELTLPQTQTQEKISRVWGRLLGVQPIGIHDNFFELGGNSLQVVQLNQLLEKAFNAKLSISLLFENPTIETLSEAVEKIIKKGAELDDDESLLELEKDASLDDSITALNCAKVTLEKIENILITGSTGYFGAFLLYELLQKTSAHMYALVRANTVDEGKQRIKENLQELGLWEQRFSDRIVAVTGDLSKPKLGIETGLFEMLAEKVDMIYHCGAWVNMIYPYTTLKYANVFSTQEILGLASKTKVKPVHFISTVDVFSVDDTVCRKVNDQDSIGPVGRLVNGYARSKYVAEQLMFKASERGIPVTIYRPSNIVGPTQTGLHPKNSLVSLIVEGCIQIGFAPNIDSIMNLIPADYASQLTVHLSLQSDSVGKSFNVVNPKSISWIETINDLIQAGYSIEFISYEQWLEKLKALPEASDNVLVPLLTILENKKLVRKSLGAFQFDESSTSGFFSKNQIDMLSTKSHFLNAYFSYSRILGFLNSVSTSPSS